MAKKGKPKAKANIKGAPKSQARTQTKAKVESKATAKTSTASARRSTRKTEAAPVQMPFGRMNYLLMIAGVAVIAIGFFLMSLDPFIDAAEFSISLYIAPVVVVAGFVGIIYAIMYKPKEEIGSTTSAVEVEG